MENELRWWAQFFIDVLLFMGVLIAWKMSEREIFRKEIFKMKTEFVGQDVFKIEWATPSDLQFHIEKLIELKRKWANDLAGMNHLEPLVWAKGRHTEGL